MSVIKAGLNNISEKVVVAPINKRLPSLVRDKVFGKYYAVSAKVYERMRDVLI